MGLPANLFRDWGAVTLFAAARFQTGLDCKWKDGMAIVAGGRITTATFASVPARIVFLRLSLAKVQEMFRSALLSLCFLTSRNEGRRFLEERAELNHFVDQS